MSEERAGYEVLTPAQAHFVQRILAGDNQTQAYLMAYPDASYETAMRAGSRMMRHDEVALAIQHGRDALGFQSCLLQALNDL